MDGRRISNVSVIEDIIMLKGNGAVGTQKVARD